MHNTHLYIPQETVFTPVGRSPVPEYDSCQRTCYVKRRFNSRDSPGSINACAYRLTMEPDLENAHSKEELAKFLERVDEVG